MLFRFARWSPQRKGSQITRTRERSLPALREIVVTPVLLCMYALDSLSRSRGVALIPAPSNLAPHQWTLLPRALAIYNARMGTTRGRGAAWVLLVVGDVLLVLWHSRSRSDTKISENDCGSSPKGRLRTDLYGVTSSAFNNATHIRLCPHTPHPTPHTHFPHTYLLCHLPSCDRGCLRGLSSRVPSSLP